MHVIAHDNIQVLEHSADTNSVVKISNTEYRVNILSGIDLTDSFENNKRLWTKYTTEFMTIFYQPEISIWVPNFKLLDLNISNPRLCYYFKECSSENDYVASMELLDSAGAFSNYFMPHRNYDGVSYINTGKRDRKWDDYLNEYGTVRLNLFHYGFQNCICGYIPIQWLRHINAPAMYKLDNFPRLLDANGFDDMQVGLLIDKHNTCPVDLSKYVNLNKLKDMEYKDMSILELREFINHSRANIETMEEALKDKYLKETLDLYGVKIGGFYSVNYGGTRRELIYLYSAECMLSDKESDVFCMGYARKINAGNYKFRERPDHVFFGSNYTFTELSQPIIDSIKKRNNIK